MKSLKAEDIRTHTQKIGKWVNWKKTCDKFLIGNSENEVKGIAVSWMPTLHNLKVALDTKCNLFVTHEPLYIREKDPSKSLKKEDAWVKKKQLLQDSEMIVYRCHDFWDDYPEDGIHGAWAKWLGFNERPVQQKRFYEIHKVNENTLEELAHRILQRVKLLGQESVHIVGDPDRKVSRIALGTGAITDYQEMYSMGADVLLVTDDGTRLWESGQWSLDFDVPLIIVNHSTSEEPGMITLARYVQSVFREVPVIHIPVGCIYHSII